MSEGIPAHRLAAAVPQAIALVGAVDTAKTDHGASLEGAMTAALGEHADPEALVLALSNMCHALAVTLARQTGTTVADLLASMSQVGPGTGNAG